MRLVEWQSNPAHPYQKFGIELDIVSSENQDVEELDVVGFGDVFGGVEAQETCFAFEAHAPLRMHIRVDQTSAEESLAVHCLEAGHGRPRWDVGPWPAAEGTTCASEAFAPARMIAAPIRAPAMRFTGSPPW